MRAEFDVSNLVAIPLPDGRWIALAPDALREALDAAQSLGLAPAPPASSAINGGGGIPERWLTSEQLQELTGIHSTTWESRAKSGEVPHRRVGKALRFKISEIEAALKAAA